MENQPEIYKKGSFRADLEKCRFFAGKRTWQQWWLRAVGVFWVTLISCILADYSHEHFFHSRLDEPLLVLVALGCYTSLGYSAYCLLSYAIRWMLDHRGWIAFVVPLAVVALTVAFHLLAGFVVIWTYNSEIMGRTMSGMPV